MRSFLLCPALIFCKKFQPSNVKRTIQRKHCPSNCLCANDLHEVLIFQAGYSTICECIEILDLNALPRLHCREFV